MVRRDLVLASIVLTATVLGCSEPQPTPPHVVAEFESLLESVDEPVGASIARLTEFMTEHDGFDIGPTVEREIDRLLLLTDGRYHEARELAREGEFERAESILTDLATHLPETADGKSAEQHLEFGFYMGKAEWLMVRQRWAESGEVARRLLERDLTSGQQNKVEAILDGAGMVGAAHSQAEKAQARSAVRHLTILLETTYVDIGSYPSTFTLADAEVWDPVGGRSILSALSAIEDYQRTERGFSFTAVSASGEHRIRVVDGVIER